jgi:hypothetical protein
MLIFGNKRVVRRVKWFYKAYERRFADSYEQRRQCQWMRVGNERRLG